MEMYSIDGILCSSQKKVYLLSSFNLVPHSNISCEKDQLERFGDLFELDISNPVRIQRNNVNMQIEQRESKPLQITESCEQIAVAKVEVTEANCFFSEAAVDEDPSVIPEEWTLAVHKNINRRAERLCNEIMKQLGFGADITAIISQRMTSEEKLVQYLAFSILPYSMEAFDCRPYETSDRLQKYAGEQGKCKQKSLLLGWFGNE